MRVSELRKKITERKKPLPILVLSGIEMLLMMVIVKIFGRLAFRPEYLRGKYFERIWSPGWRWAYNGMFSKLFKGTGRGIPWPVSSQGSFSKDIEFHVDDLNNFQGPIYLQAFDGAKITLGRGIWIARGCALITSNHDLVNPDLHTAPEDIEIGDHCWLGSNVVITPGIVLGPHTVVGANAVVTKSFPEGWCVLGGVPAKKIKNVVRQDFDNEDV